MVMCGALVKQLLVGDWLDALHTWISCSALILIYCSHLSSCCSVSFGLRKHLVFVPLFWITICIVSYRFNYSMVRFRSKIYSIIIHAVIIVIKPPDHICIAITNKHSIKFKMKSNLKTKYCIPNKSNEQTP